MTDWTEHSGLMANRIRAAGVPEDLVDDIMHDAIINLLEYTGEVGNAKNLAAQTAYNQGLMYQRKLASDRRLGEQFQKDTVDTVVQDGSTVAVSQGVSPETQAINSDLLQKALGSLTNKQANSIFLVDYMGYTFQEGADNRGVSKASFHRTYKRAKEGLKRWAASQR